jgi:hypothetical protein
MRLRTFVTPLVIAALAISLTGCGAGSNATTRLTKKVTDGQEAEIKNDNNKMVLRNFVLVAQPDGSAVVVGTAVNRGLNDDALLGLAINGVNLKPGTNVDLSLFFGVAGEISFKVLVRGAEGIYADITSGLVPPTEPTA